MIKFILNTQEFIYTVDMFRDILHLLVETPENPFVAPVNIEIIETFINRVGYQGVVDKVSAFYMKNLAQPWQTMFKVFNRYLTIRTSGHDQTKINIIQMFHAVINRTNVDYAALLWIEEDYHSIKDDIPLVSVYTIGDVRVRGMLILDAFFTKKIRATDDFKEYEMVFMNIDVPMNQPKPVVSTQGTQRQQKVVEGEKDNDDFEDILDLGSHKDNPEHVDDDDKDAEKVDEEEGCEMGSLETRTEEMQTPIPTPPRFPRKILSSDKNITQELTNIVPLPTTTTSNTPHFKRQISGKYNHLPGILQLAEKATEDLIENNLKSCIAATIIKDRDAFRSEVPDLVSQEFNAQAPKIIEDLFKNYVQSNVIQVHPTTATSTETTSSADLQQQLYFKMKRSLQDQANVIMEYLVNISKRHAFWSLNEDILKIYYSKDQYAVSIKEDTAYQDLHSPKTTKEIRSIRRIQKMSKRRIEDIVCEYSGRYQTWSLLQETSIQCIQSLGYAVKMDDPNITMEEYIRLKEEKARRRGKVYNWETATYGKILYDEDVHDLISVETEFPAIVFDDAFTYEVTHSCEPTVSPLNDNKIDFRISFDESDDEDYTPTVSCLNDLDFFKDFENEFPAIVYNDALTSKSYLLTEPAMSSQHIDDLKDETSLFECDKEEQNILYFNDVFSFNVIYPDDSKLDKDNDDDKINIK
ncbi:hypothetical protein Tco_0524041 [Tanacetum coccineum]